jgi:hypothetical protein
MYLLHLDVKVFKLKAGEWRNTAIKAAIRWRKPTGSCEAALAHTRRRYSQR